MPIHRRLFLKLTCGTAVASAGFAIGAPAILHAATPVKMTLPWLPLGTFSYAFVANKMGFWEKRGLEVTIDRGFGSGRVCVPVDQGQYDFGILDLAVMMNTRLPGWQNGQFGIGFQFFNVFNHANFGVPDGFSAASTFGQIIYTASPPTGIFGRGVSARMIQVKAQLEF